MEKENSVVEGASASEFPTRIFCTFLAFTIVRLPGIQPLMCSGLAAMEHLQKITYGTILLPFFSNRVWLLRPAKESAEAFQGMWTTVGMLFFQFRVGVWIECAGSPQIHCGKTKFPEASVPNH